MMPTMTDTTPDLPALAKGSPAPPPNAERVDWIQTFSGHAVFPATPLPGEIHIEDIAHHLAMLCRYAGAVSRFYSVAEHSVLVSNYLLPLYGPEVAFQGLMHDAPEAYLVDLPRPVKLILPGYIEMEQKIEHAVALRYGLSDTFDPAVKDADTRILMDERTELLKPPPIPWRTDLEPLGVTVEGWGPRKAERLFLNQFDYLNFQRMTMEPTA